MNLTRRSLVKQMVKDCHNYDLTQEQARRVVQAFIDTIKERVSAFPAGGRFCVKRFGCFKWQVYAPFKNENVRGLRNAPVSTHREFKFLESERVRPVTKKVDANIYRAPHEYNSWLY